MSNLHRDLDEFNLHNPKGFNPATPNTFATKSEQGSSYYEERMQLPKVINIVDGNLPAPSTADLDAFIIIDGGGGVLDISWGPSSFNDWVRFNGGVPYRISPLAGYLAYNENGSQWKEFDGSNWVDFGGGGVVNTLYIADGTLAGPRTVGTGGNTLSFVAANGTQTVEPVEIITGGNTSPFDAFLIKKPNGFRLFDVDGDGLGIMTQAVQDVSLTIDSFGGSAQSDALLVRSSSSTTFFRSVNSGKVAIGETISTILNSGSVAGAAVLNVGGKGSTSGTTALLVQNSLSTNLLEVKDDGTMGIGTAPVANQPLTVTAADRYAFVSSGGFNNTGGISGIKLTSDSTTTNNIIGLDLTSATNRSWIGTTNNSVSASFTGLDNSTLIYNEGASGKGLNLVAFTASGIIRMMTGGNNERIRVDSSGNVGINQTSPTAKLHVSGSSLLGGDTEINGSLKVNTGVNFNRVKVETDSASQGAAVEFFNNGVNTGNIIAFGSSYSSPIEAQGKLVLSSNGTGQLYVDNSSNGYKWNLGGYANTNTRMQLTSTGLAIGTNLTPTAKLHVQGSGSTSGTTALLVQNSLSTNLLEVKDDGSTTIGGNTQIDGSLRINDGTQANGYILTSDANGNASWSQGVVLNGENDTRLNVENTSADGLARLRLQGESGSGSRVELVNWGSTSNDLFGINSSYNDSAVLLAQGKSKLRLNLVDTPLFEIITDIGAQTSPTTRVVMNDLGEFAIGSNTSPITGKKLYVNGASRFDNELNIQGAGTTSTSTALIVQNNGAAATMLECRNDNAIGLYGATPVTQATTAGGSALLSTGGGTGLTDTDTFDGYTLQQVVKALRDLGILA